MKMKCLFKSVLRGDIVKPGQILELTEAECKMDVVKNFFVKVDGDAASGDPSPAAAPVPASPEAGVVAGLSRDQAIMKLTQAGVKCKGNISNANLVALYNQTFANAAEATAK